MSVFPCSVCKRRIPGKLASAYWAWFNSDGGRSAWLMRYCPGCAQTDLQALLQSLLGAGDSSNVFACCVCGASAEQDSDPMYLTLYLPKRDPMEFAVQLDAACAVKLRSPITQSGSRLPDRGGVVRGPSPATSAWDALGLAPD